MCQITKMDPFWQQNSLELAVNSGGMWWCDYKRIDAWHQDTRNICSGQHCLARLRSLQQAHILYTIQHPQALLHQARLLCSAAAARQRRGVLVNAAGCCFLNAVAMVGVVPYRKYAAGSPAPSPELSAFFLVSSLLALLPYSVKAVSFSGFWFQPYFSSPIMLVFLPSTSEPTRIFSIRAGPKV